MVALFPAIITVVLSVTSTLAAVIPRGFDVLGTQELFARAGNRRIYVPPPGRDFGQSSDSSAISSSQGSIELSAGRDSSVDAQNHSGGIPGQSSELTNSPTHSGNSGNNPGRGTSNADGATSAMTRGHMNHDSDHGDVGPPPTARRANNDHTQGVNSALPAAPASGRATNTRYFLRPLQGKQRNNP